MNNDISKLKMFSLYSKFNFVFLNENEMNVSHVLLIALFPGVLYYVLKVLYLIFSTLIVFPYLNLFRNIISVYTVNSFIHFAHRFRYPLLDVHLNANLDAPLDALFDA